MLPRSGLCSGPLRIFRAAASLIPGRAVRPTRRREGSRGRSTTALAAEICAEARIKRSAWRDASLAASQRMRPRRGPGPANRGPPAPGPLGPVAGHAARNWHRRSATVARWRLTSGVVDYACKRTRNGCLPRSSRELVLVVLHCVKVYPEAAALFQCW